MHKISVGSFMLLGDTNEEIRRNFELAAGTENSRTLNWSSLSSARGES